MVIQLTDSWDMWFSITIKHLIKVTQIPQNKNVFRLILQLSLTNPVK